VIEILHAQDVGGEIIGPKGCAAAKPYISPQPCRFFGCHHGEQVIAPEGFDAGELDYLDGPTIVELPFVVVVEREFGLSGEGEGEQEQEDDNGGDLREEIIPAGLRALG
jgi:hypothetical protein